MLPLFVAIPLAAAFIISLIGKYYRRAGDVLANLASFALLVLSFFALSTLSSQSSTASVYRIGGWGGIPPIGILMVLVMGSVASCFILLGIALLYSYTSSLNMADISATLAVKGHSNIVAFISVLFLMGFCLKAAVVPFHAWLPDAHPSAPAPISAMLSGVLIKTLGIYALCRVFFNGLGVSSALLLLLIILGIISMCIGAFLAIGQNDIKRMLAYSSISQIGYIIFAVGIGTPLAILGGLFHLLNHAIFKSLLFLNSGAIEYTAKTRDLNQMGGLNKSLPVTGYTSLVGSMSISGIPPLSGFWSKLIIIIAAIQAGYFGFAIIAVLVSILTLAYYLKLQRYAFFGELNKKWEKIKEVPFAMKLSMVILSVISLAGGNNFNSST